MDFNAGIPMPRTSVTEGPSSIDQDALWEMNLRSKEGIDSGAYPVREGQPECSYYIRTGLCRYGATCRFNHPPNRKLAIATARMRGEYPERIGQTECQYYLKTGICKFGATCKFHHPKEKAGIEGRVTLNVLGYPLRPNEVECAYYLRTGHCKFGNTCKFNHSQPANMMVSVHGSPAYPPVNSRTNPTQLSYPMSGASYVPSPRWQGPPTYSPMLLPQGMVSVPGWSTYTGQVPSNFPNENQQETTINHQTHGITHQSEGAIMESQGVYSSYNSASVPVGYYPLQREAAVFPERQGQPECQFYMKTGDCKFGAVCKFHHPRERMLPPPDCVLSPIGLPLRPGEPLCIFYSRYGICKFGPSCKFDHPMGVFTYSLPSPSAEPPVVRRVFGGSSSGPGALASVPEALIETTSTKTRLLGHDEVSIEPEE